MPFTVVHGTGMTKDAEYQEYDRLLSRLLLKQGVNLAEVPRVRDPGTDNRYLYVWQTKQEARDFANQLEEQTRPTKWVVREVDAQPSVGPLRPLEIQIGRNRHGWTFALAPWARKALQSRFPGSCQSQTVFIASGTHDDFKTTRGGLDHLAEQMLLVLTDLSAEQLRPFGTYLVTDPVSEKVLLAPTPIHPGAGGVLGVAPSPP